jgi:hypothetical protein
VNAITQRGGRITSVHFVVAHLEDDLAHGFSLEGCLDRGKPGPLASGDTALALNLTEGRPTRNPREQGLTEVGSAGSRVLANPDRRLSR